MGIRCCLTLGLALTLASGCGDNLRAVPDAALPDAGVDLVADAAAEAADAVPEDAGSDAIWPPEACSSENHQPSCNFVVPDCDGTTTTQLWDYHRSAAWPKGVFVVKLPYDDPTPDMIAWLDMVAPWYESQGVKVLFVVGYAKDTENAADAAQCREVKQTAAGGLRNLTVLRDVLGPESVASVFQCSTPYCYFMLDADLLNQFRLCGRYWFVTGTDVQNELAFYLDMLIAGEL